jgi:hypothetical protein
MPTSTSSRTEQDTTPASSISVQYCGPGNCVVTDLWGGESTDYADGTQAGTRHTPASFMKRMPSDRYLPADPEASVPSATTASSLCVCVRNDGDDVVSPCDSCSP